jgi:hypothetical protein
MSEPHSSELINVVDPRWSCPSLVIVECMLIETNTVMGFKTLYNALVHWLNVGSKVWLKIFNTDVGEAFRRNVP